MSNSSVSGRLLYYIYVYVLLNKVLFAPWVTIIYIDYQVRDLFVKLFVYCDIILNDP